MRHRNKGFKLGRTSSHRKATLAALSNALIEHKRIRTTLTKAKALRMYVEPIINRAKEDTTHNRRMVFRSLQSKHSVKELFSEVKERIGDRPGGYTRIVKLGQRAGDAAEMALIELVDFNEEALETAASTTSKRRTRRSSTRRKKSTGAAATATAEADAPAEEAPEAAAEEAPEAAADEASDEAAEDDKKAE